MSFVIKNTRETATKIYDAGTYYQVDLFGLTKNLGEARVFPRRETAQQALRPRFDKSSSEIVEVIIMETDTLVKKLAETLTNDQLRELNSLRSFKL
jgi:hypothetical protein